MSTDHTNQMTAQIQRYDQMKSDLGDGFTDAVAGELVDLTHTHTFEAELVEDPRIVAIANIDLDGRIEDVSVTAPGDGTTEITDVDPSSGLWAAMEAWLADFRESWRED